MCNIRKLEQDRKMEVRSKIQKNKNSKLYQALADAIYKQLCKNLSIQNTNGRTQS